MKTKINCSAGVGYKEGEGWFPCIQVDGEEDVITNGKSYQTKEEAEKNLESFFNNFVKEYKFNIKDFKLIK